MRGSVKTVDPPSIARDEGPAQWAVYLYTTFLQGLFNHAPRKQHRWEPNLKDTEIVITAEAPVDLEAVQKYPHLVVQRGGYQWSNLSFDKMRNARLLTGERVHTDLESGNLSVHCIAEVGMEASQLAAMVQLGTTYHHALLQRVGGFHHIGHNVSVGPESPPGALVRDSSEAELVMVDVLVPWFLQWTWESRPKTSQQHSDLRVFLGPNAYGAGPDEGYRARDAIYEPFVMLNDIILRAHYGLATSEEVVADYGMRDLDRDRS